MSHFHSVIVAVIVIVIVVVIIVISVISVIVVGVFFFAFRRDFKGLVRRYAYWSVRPSAMLSTNSSRENNATYSRR